MGCLWLADWWRETAVEAPEDQRRALVYSTTDEKIRKRFKEIRSGFRNIDLMLCIPFLGNVFKLSFIGTLCPSTVLLVGFTAQLACTSMWQELSNHDSEMWYSVRWGFSILSECCDCASKLKNSEKITISRMRMEHPVCRWVRAEEG